VRPVQAEPVPDLVDEVLRVRSLHRLLRGPHRVVEACGFRVRGRERVQLVRLAVLGRRARLLRETDRLGAVAPLGLASGGADPRELRCDGRLVGRLREPLPEEIDRVGDVARGEERRDEGSDPVQILRVELVRSPVVTDGVVLRPELLASKGCSDHFGYTGTSRMGQKNLAT